ncbi:MAG: glycosyltransferase family 39 protein [Candidatus Hydrogenedentes bacterium]|nr:glycosyltransferase family 39 protein [Candidatus Hydrogenedentota bacterium]
MSTAPRDGDGSILLSCRPVPAWEWMLAGLAVAIALVLGFSRLSWPSLWHDELIHVFVAKGIIGSGLPQLPSGRMFTEGTLYNYLLAGVMLLFGDGEAAVRAPSVIANALNVLGTYLVVRRILGAPTALVAAFALALSPWSVAWSRQARFYALQQTMYLATLYAVWRCGEAPDRGGIVRWGLGACGAYVVGLLSGPHSVFFLAPVGAYAGLHVLRERCVKSRWFLMAAAVVLLGVLTVTGHFLTLPQAEFDATFKDAQIGGSPPDPGDRDQSDRLYYFRFFTNNLSTGYFILACVGFVWMVVKEGRRGVFTAIAFLAPILVLNFLIGYRRHRFIFFAYPFYVAAFSYALVRLAAFLPSFRRSWPRAVAAVCVVAFGARLAISTVRLVQDSMRVAGGADATLAVAHPQWRKPCLYIRDHLNGEVVLTTTYITALYYVGRVDNWYPSRVIVWEHIESGMEGLKTLDDLKAYVREHPKGFFVAERRRFHHWYFFAEDVAWVEQHMERLDAASGEDVILYRWGPP